MIKAIPKSLLQVIETNDNLSRYLDNLSQGKKATERSWLYETKDPEEVLADWLSILDSLKNGNSFENEVYQFDTSQLAKWGPQGAVPPIGDILDSIVLPTFSPHKKANAWFSREWVDATRAVTRRWVSNYHIRQLYPASVKRVVDDMRARDTLESNSGWPDFARRSLPEVKQHAIAECESGLWKYYPAIALFRNYNLKTRLVWMFPMATNLREGQFYQPLQKAIVNARAPFYIPWIGFEAVRERITQAYNAGKFIYATDFSKTDEHFRSAASKRVLEVLAPLFARKEDREGLIDSVMRMHKIPLLISPTEEIVGSHGVASGSNWTNFIESVFDELFAEYVSKFSSAKGFYAIGDDMAWISDKFDDAFASTVSELGENVGQDVNVEKVTAYPDKVKSLQRLFQRGYYRDDGLVRGVYSTIRALKSSIYPEKYHKPSLWSSDMFCARQFMILENCVDHPLFEEFVKFVCRGQKDLIPFSKKSSGDLQRILRETKLLPGFNPTYNQERRDTSLSNFESIKIARGM